MIYSLAFVQGSSSRLCSLIHSKEVKQPNSIAYVLISVVSAANVLYY